MGWFQRNEHSEEQLSAYLDGELDARQAEKVARHLSGCPACTATLEDLRSGKALLAELPRLAPSRSFVLGPEHARERAVSRPRQRSAFAFAPAIAATVLVALLVFDFGSFSSSSNDHSTGTLAEKSTASRQADEAGGAGSSLQPAQAPALGGSSGTANSTGSADAAAGTPQSLDAPQSAPAPAVPGPTMSTFAAGTDSSAAATPEAPTVDAPLAAADSQEDDGGISLLRVLEVLAGAGLLASVFFVYVRPRLTERK
jgi:anti-sigma factor RsiW